MPLLRIALAQLNLFVGDVAGNTQRVIDTAAEARDRLKADLVLFPELSLCGYPPEDLLFHKGLRRQVAAALERVRSEVQGITVMVGYPEYADDDIYNAAALVRDGEHARELPQAGAAELRGLRREALFQARAARRCIVEMQGHSRRAADLRRRLGAEARARRARRPVRSCIVVINGSPYSLDYQERREDVVRERVRETRVCRSCT